MPCELPIRHREVHLGQARSQEVVGGGKDVFGRAN